MIGYRHADPRYPFLWEATAQPAARWHGEGEGPAHYFADTPEGAWAEFIRHEEIVDADDLAGVRRDVWAVDLGDVAAEAPALVAPVLRGGRDSYPTCQSEARRLRAQGTSALSAPSAALLPGQASGWHTDRGLRRAEGREGSVVAIFGARPDLEGWRTCAIGRPHPEILGRVRHYGEPHGS